MSFLSSLRNERVVLVAGLGAATLGIVGVMLTALVQHRDDTEIKPVQPKTQYITQETEDSLPLSTLETLTGHYNYAIRETSAKIICDRAVNDPETVHTLLWGLTRPDYDERVKSLRALAMITDQQHLHILNTPKAYSAFVRSLELCALEAEYVRLDDKYYDEYPLRDIAEKIALLFILQLLNKYGTRDMVRYKFIEKWVVRQNWGDTDEERQRNFHEYLQTKQNRVSEICQMLKDSEIGRKRLEEVRLLPEGGGPDETRFSVVLSICMTNENGEPHAEMQVTEALMPRITDQSVEEQRLRRQHREAMVFNDGTRPVERGDIIERDRD